MTAVEQKLLTFQFSNLRKHQLIHGMSGRNPHVPAEGDIAYSPVTEAHDTTSNRVAFFSELGIDPKTLTLGKQVHGKKVVPALRSDIGRGQPPAFDGFPDTDGLLTSEPGLTLGVIVGDCVPLVLYDYRKHVVAVVHAGWRGTVAGISAEAVEMMKRGYNSRPASIIAGIGPSIGPCCYEVGDDVIDAWNGVGLKYGRHAVMHRDGKQFFDLWTANRQILLTAGVLRRNIEDSAICTKCHQHEFFSRRAFVAGESRKGSQMMVVQLKPRA